MKSVGSLWRSLVAYVSWKSFGSLMSQLFQIFILQINIETPELFAELPFIFYIFLIQGCGGGGTFGQTLGAKQCAVPLAVD